MNSADAAAQCGLGCVNLGASSRNGIRLVHHAMDLGVRFFDTADAYGGGASERVLGRALRHRRDDAFIATKGGYLFSNRTALERASRRLVRPVLQRASRLARGSGPTPPLAGRRGYAAQDFSANYLRSALVASLRRLDTDYVDLYQLHGPRHVSDDDVLAMMLDLRSEGKIRGFGIGLESLDTAMDWLATGALSSIQIPFGVLDPEARVHVIPGARTQGVPVVARGVFAGGFLVDRGDGDDALLRARQPQLRRAVRALASANAVDPLQIGAWFVTAHPGVTTVLVGTSSGQHLEESLRYFEEPRPEGMLPLLDALAVPDALAAPDDAARVTDPSRTEGGGP